MLLPTVQASSSTTLLLNPYTGKQLFNLSAKSCNCHASNKGTDNGTHAFDPCCASQEGTDRRTGRGPKHPEHTTANTTVHATRKLQHTYSPSSDWVQSLCLQPWLLDACAQPRAVILLYSRGPEVSLPHTAPSHSTSLFCCTSLLLWAGPTCCSTVRQAHMVHRAASVYNVHTSWQSSSVSCNGTWLHNRSSLARSNWLPGKVTYHSWQ